MFEEAKSKGNAVFSAGDYVAAVKHFTDTVPLSPTQPMFLLNVKFGGPNSGDDMEIPEETSTPHDWVSDLRTNSIRGRVTSEDESDSDMGRRYRSKSGRGRETDSGGNRGGGAGVLSTKRRRESNSNEFSEPTRRRTESTFGSPTRDRGTVGLPNARR
ncbi:hypothetical protein OIU79_009490 [Salix purpurea]|uniref:Uncharacterized protein n=1 Tax=Salix purpurea TaxID=77065 RepID=A0A9Q0TKY3_SALPP|nr:hypothetical protein OIU79_009490 [Salix purpurea]